MSISPNGQILAAVHASGALSLWDLPSLKLKKFWDLQLQVLVTFQINLIFILCEIYTGKFILVS